nr:putative ribonuclease H-like domain-containing protein [Tanacetum cinerariifolium]
SECDEQVILVPSFPSNSFSSPTIKDVSAPIENNLDYAEELARLQRQEYEAHSAAAKHGFEFSVDTAALLPQANIEIRRNLVHAAGDPAGGIIPTGGCSQCGVLAGSLGSTDSAASSVPAGGVLAGSLGSTDSAASSVPAASVFVPAVVPTDSAANSPLPPIHSLGSCTHTTKFPSPSDLGNHKHTAGIFSSSSYDDDFCADVTNLDSNIPVDSVATKRVNSIHPQSQILRDLQSPVQTRSTVQKSKFGESAFISYVQNQNRTNHADHLHCLFACFLSQLEPSSVATALADPDWVAAMQEEMQQTRGMPRELWFEIKLDWWLKAIGKRRALIMMRVVKALYGLHQAPRVCQDKYVKDMLKKFDMESVRTATIPYEVPKHKSKDEPDDAVNVSPLTSHLNAVKKIFKYLKGQPNLGLWYPRDSPFQLEAYSDSDYAGSHSDRKSTTDGCQFLGRRLISWQCKKQIVVATSSTEAEYVTASSCCGQVLWIQNQMLDYGFNFMNTRIFIDTQSTICIVKNPVFHQRTKHIEILHHFIRDAYEKNLIQDAQSLGTGIEGRITPKGRLTIVYTVRADDLVSAGDCILPAGSYSFLLLDWFLLLLVHADEFVLAGRYTITTGSSSFLLLD